MTKAYLLKSWLFMLPVLALLMLGGQVSAHPLESAQSTYKSAYNAKPIAHDICTTSNYLISTSTSTPTGTPEICISQWTIVSSPNVGASFNYLKSISVVSANDIWAVGAYGDSAAGMQRTLIEHWNGTAWLVVSSPNVGANNNRLNGVVAISPNDVWAVGSYFAVTKDQTLIEHWNGSSWSVITSPNLGSSNNYLNGVAATSTNDVWAVGSYYGSEIQTLVLHWEGLLWSVVTSPNVGVSTNVLEGVTAVSADDVWAVGAYQNGGFAPTLIEHWNGSSWSVVPSQSPGSNNHLFGVASVSANDIWAVGFYANSGFAQSLVEHWNGSSWSVVSLPTIGTSHSFLNGVAKSASNDVWATGYYSNGGPDRTLVEHWDGASWSVESTLNSGSSDNQLYGVATVAEGDAWVVGNYYSSEVGTAQTLVERSLICEMPTSTATPTYSYTNTSTGTPTPSNTPTNTPIKLLVGRVIEQGCPANANPITLTLKSGANEANYGPQTPDAAGFFTVNVSSLPADAYQWRAKGVRYLAKVGGVTIPPIASTTQLEIGLLTAGDINDDNNISVSDFNLLKGSFGRQIGDPGYNPNADFTCNGVINIQEQNILRANFGLSGSPPILPGVSK